MRSSNKVCSQLIMSFFICALLTACASSTVEEKEQETPANPSAEAHLSIEDESDPTPVFEEVLPDTGLMNNVNPEEIITDDWTSDSPDAESSDD